MKKSTVNKEKKAKLRLAIKDASADVKAAKANASAARKVATAANSAMNKASKTVDKTVAAKGRLTARLAKVA